MQIIFLFVVIIFIIIATGFVTTLLNNIQISILPYQKKQYLLSKAEKSFFGILNKIFENEEYYICPKVRLADFISIKKGTKKRYSFLNRITSKHVDFLICDSKYLSPQLVIELDDKSHRSEKAIKSDNFKNKAFKDANIKFIRIEASKSYNVEEIKEVVFSLIEKEGGYNE